MPIPYAERKKRRQALRQEFSPALRERLALRHVEAVAKLAPEAQRTLGKALPAGLRGIPEAIATLREHPEISVEALLGGGNSNQKSPSSSAHKAERNGFPAKSTPDAQAKLPDLLRECFPGMPVLTAEALAEDDLFTEVSVLLQAQGACTRSDSIQSELVFVALCGLALRFLDELTRLRQARPHYARALAQSGIAKRFLHDKSQHSPQCAQ